MAARRLVSGAPAGNRSGGLEQATGCEFVLLRAPGEGELGPRAGVLRTAHGPVETPAFMPVGTHAAVSAVTAETLEGLGVEVVVCNAFHLARAPGEAALRRFESVHQFMGWPRAILTDSGGFQVCRMQGCGVTDAGIELPSGQDRIRVWTPEQAIATQALLGSDLVMCLDQCVALPASRVELREATWRTVRWARRSLEAGGLRPYQFLFGIVQGGTDPELRAACAAELCALDFGGYAVGGLNVGESEAEYRATLEHTVPLLPRDRPRYLMGVGRPRAMLDAVATGIDLMDSILPAKCAREGSALTRHGILHLKGTRFRRDTYPLDPHCSCYTCRTVSRAYLHHLMGTTRSSAQVLLTIHNLSFCLELVRAARSAILRGEFAAFRRDFEAGYGSARTAPETRDGS